MCSQNTRLGAERTPKGAGHWVEMALQILPARSALPHKNTSQACVISSFPVVTSHRREEAGDASFSNISLTSVCLQCHHFSIKSV